MDFTVTESTTLDDLLALQLHLLEDKVRNIVDKAVKEMAIEKVFFSIINRLWSNTLTLVFYQSFMVIMTSYIM